MDIHRWKMYGRCMDIHKWKMNGTKYGIHLRTMCVIHQCITWMKDKWNEKWNTSMEEVCNTSMYYVESTYVLSKGRFCRTAPFIFGNTYIFH